MTCRSVLVAALLVCAMDFSMPVMPGTFAFDSAVDSIHGGSVATPVMTLEAAPFVVVPKRHEPAPRVAAGRPLRSVARFPTNHLPREGLAPPVPTEDPH